jgi:hypothetical protein
MGVPQVVSNVSGNTDLVIEGRTGWLYAPPEDARALARVLAQAAGQPARHARRHGRCQPPPRARGLRHRHRRRPSRRALPIAHRPEAAHAMPPEAPSRSRSSSSASIRRTRSVRRWRSVLTRGAWTRIGRSSSSTIAPPTARVAVSGASRHGTRRSRHRAGRRTAAAVRRLATTGSRGPRAPMWRCWTATTSGSPDKIATQIAALEAFPEIGLLFSDYFGIRQQWTAGTRGAGTAYAADDGDQLRRFFIHGGPVLPSCAVLSRAAIDKRRAVRPGHALQRGRGILAARGGGGAASSPTRGAGAQTGMVRQPRLGEIRAGEPRLPNGRSRDGCCAACRTWRMRGPRARRGSTTRRRCTSSPRARLRRPGGTCAVA